MQEESGMPPEKKHNIICKNEADFERIFLPATHEKKIRKQAMEDPKKFGEHLEKELRRRIKAK
jgi:hypothetical protein